MASILGGVGRFLPGMVLLTDGIEAVAGNALRRMLSRMAGNPLKAVFSGPNLVT